MTEIDDDLLVHSVRQGSALLDTCESWISKGVPVYPTEARTLVNMCRNLRRLVAEDCQVGHDLYAILGNEEPPTPDELTELSLKLTAGPRVYIWAETTEPEAVPAISAADNYVRALNATPKPPPQQTQDTITDIDNKPMKELGEIISMLKKLPDPVELGDDFEDVERVGLDGQQQ